MKSKAPVGGPKILLGGPTSGRAIDCLRDDAWVFVRGLLFGLAMMGN
jgi:hypothetical protein